MRATDYLTLGAGVRMGQMRYASHKGTDLATTLNGVVDLDPEHFATLSEFERRFAGGAPSLRRATRLEVCGDVSFGRGVEVHGEAKLVAAPGERLHVADHEVVGG